MKTKEELIQEYKASPLKAGEKVVVYKNSYSSDYTKLDGIEKDKNQYATVVSVDKNITVRFSEHNYNTIIHPDFIKEKLTHFIGYNPFPERSWDSDVRFISFNLECILRSIGLDSRKMTFKNEKFGDVVIPELEWNPIVVNDQGVEVSYQRDFVWSLKDKQLLIESIYNNIEIGKIIVRKRSWEYVEDRVKGGKIAHTAFKDIVDGKQRLNAILGFVMNEYPDLNGYHFRDLSDSAQYKFDNFHAVSYGEIGEGATDKSVQGIFLNINFAGVQMSKEHIEFVKSIKI